MGTRLDPPEDAAGLAIAARRYAANLLAATADFTPEVIASVRHFFSLISRAEDTDDDVPEHSTWAWARFLAGWPSWRPHRLERRLLLPPGDQLQHLTARIRSAVEAVEPANRLWSLFARPGSGTAMVEPRDVLAEAAEVLDSLIQPLSPAKLAVLDRAVELGRSVDMRIRPLPSDWLPLRLVRAGESLPHWPEVPPTVVGCEFLALLAGLVESAVERGPFPTAPDAFRAVLIEALDELRAEDLLPSGAVGAPALDALRTAESPVAVSLWLKVIAELLSVVDSQQPPTRWAVLLARLAARVVEQVAPKAEPPVNPKTLAVPRDWCRPGRATLRYAIHPSAPRSVVRIDRFAIPPDRAEVTLSLGANPTGATIWLSIDESMLAAAGGDGVMLADRCRKRAEAEFWKRTADSEDPKQLRRDLNAWLDTTAGKDWFHTVAETATRSAPPDAAAQALLNAVRHSSGVECFPAIDLQTGQCSWPANVPFTVAAVSFIVSDEPKGSILAVERFSTTPSAARMRVSLGPIGEQGSAVAAVWDAILAEGLELDECRGILAPALEATAHTGTPVPSDVLIAIIDHLTETESTETHALSVRDELLAHLRRWGAIVGLAIQPAEWTFTTGGPAPAGDVLGLVVKPVFRRDVPGGRVAKMKRFGLVEGNEVRRVGEVVISAGPPPHGLSELEAAAESLAGLEGEELRETFRGLRAAGAAGYLELAIVDLFTRFWDRVYPVWVSVDPTVADDFAERLRLMLQADFGLDVILPMNYRDHPAGWVSVPPGTRMTNGRVVRVLRPGLVSGGVLRVPARVEAE